MRRALQSCSYFMLKRPESVRSFSSNVFLERSRWSIKRVRPFERTSKCVRIFAHFSRMAVDTFVSNVKSADAIDTSIHRGRPREPPAVNNTHKYPDDARICTFTDESAGIFIAHLGARHANPPRSSLRPIRKPWKLFHLVSYEPRRFCRIARTAE